MTSRDPEVVALDVAEEPATWAAAGFAVDGDATCRLGGVRVRLVGTDAGTGVVGWALRGLAADAPEALDGLPTYGEEVPAATPATHPLGVSRIDHLVLQTDDLERTVAAAGVLGLTERRRRDHVGPGGATVVQVFFVVGELVLEVVGPPEPSADARPGVRSFGLALVAPDLKASVAAAGDHLSPIRPAVQPGRSIASLRHRALGLDTPIALMTPRPHRHGRPPPP